MEATAEKIKLYSETPYVTQGERDAYHVLSGSVLVFIVPWEKDAPGKRLFLCEVGEGSVIPSFSYRDQSFKRWRFSLSAKDEAELELMEGASTRVLQRKLLERSGINTMASEGFEGSLVEHYTRESAKELGFFAHAVNISSYGVIKNVFNEEQGGVTPEEMENDPVYSAVSYACRWAHIPIANRDRIIACCGRDFSVTNIAKVSNFICRDVVLEKDWYKQDCGALIGTIDQQTVACVPSGRGRYRIFYTDTRKVAKLTEEVAATISPKAFAIGRVLPNTKLTGRDLFSFCWDSVNKADLAMVAVLGLAAALIGILLPTLNQKIYDDYIPLGNYSQLVQLCVVILTFMIGNMFFSIVKSLSEYRISCRVGNDLQNAVFFRIFHLPESFFRGYDSAELTQRMTSADDIASSYVNFLIVTCLSMLFSLLYLFKMFKYSSKLSWIAFAMVLCYSLILLYISWRSTKYEAIVAESDGKASSKLYQYLNGIEKIRMSGAEDRVAYEYIKPVAEREIAQLRQDKLISFREGLACVITTVFSMVLYYIIVKKKLSISMGSFVAFNSAFGSFSAALLQLLSGGADLYKLKPLYKRFKPIMETPCEDDDDKEIISGLTGEISLEHLKFSYSPESPNVLDDLSVKIKPGEYVGIVGPSGCGKSTLLKLLLGFETPNAGQILYDGKDLQSLDKRMLRKNLGVVLQNGRLIAGSIFENITITSPTSTGADVMAVLEAVGMKEDVEQMPMGIQTMLSESTGTISGGQQQRILIARAIIGRPSVLYFDEATSALDNVTQATVCESLDKMNVTRIVIAHRLSTIRRCDRILVLDSGKIAESGNYEELMDKHGLFYELARRQIAESEEDGI